MYVYLLVESVLSLTRFGITHYINVQIKGHISLFTIVSFLMKSRAQELVEKSVAAMVSAIEIYNKPDFKYREETFSILAINAWELLLKAKWLFENQNRVRSLYVMEKKTNAHGRPYKHLKVKLTECGNPFTHSLDYLAKRLVEKGKLADAAYKNIKALCEIRDSSVHFYNRNNLFALRLQEVGSSSKELCQSFSRLV